MLKARKGSKQTDVATKGTASPESVTCLGPACLCYSMCAVRSLFVLLGF